MMVHIRMEKMQYFSAIRHAYDTRITLECSEKYKHIERRTYAPLRHIPTNYIPPSVPLLLLLLSLRVSPSHVFTVHRKGRNLDATNIGKGKNIIYWMATACSISSFHSKPRVTHYYSHESWCCDGRTTGNNEIIKMNTLLVWWMCFLLHHCVHGTTKEAQNGGINHNSNSKRSIFSSSQNAGVCVCRVWGAMMHSVSEGK